MNETNTLPPSAEEENDLALVDYRDGYAILTINRQHKRNAMSIAAQKALWAALDEIKAARSKVVILTAAGEQSFCAGADIKEKIDPTVRAFASEANSWGQTQKIIAEHPAIFIGAINGYALAAA